jgi:hypothetical protein
MAAVELGIHFELMRMAVVKLDRLKVCGNCENFYYDTCGDAHCVQDGDGFNGFAGGTCKDWLFINDWEVRK